MTHYWLTWTDQNLAETSQRLCGRDDLLNMSGSATKDQVLQRLTDFMESDESEYRRIDDYFQCLAFRPDESASTQKDSP